MKPTAILNHVFLLCLILFSNKSNAQASFDTLSHQTIFDTVYYRGITGTAGNYTLGSPQSRYGVAMSSLELPDVGHSHTTTSIPDFDINPLKYRIKSARVFVMLNVGDVYKLGANTFTLTVPFDLLGKDAATATVVNLAGKSLAIKQSAPEKVFMYDFKNNFQSLKSFQLAIASGITITDLTLNPTIVEGLVKNNATLKLIYQIEYQADVRTSNSKPAPVIATATGNGKLYAFSWDNSATKTFPNYEFQLLRLYNSDPAKVTNEKDITARIDWSKALSIETQSWKKNITITVDEGTGFYVWRVRGIGEMYDGGIGNLRNWGEWSQSPEDLTDIPVNISNMGGTANPFFYFEDVDDNINWIYSRTFTEGGKVSEKISYANGLQQIKQSQAYLPSVGKTIVTQTVQDYSGRPAVNTLPVPVNTPISGYKPNFVKNTSGDLFTAADFDADANFESPQPVNDQTSSAYSYYSDNNSDINIPTANGYPYTRNLFYNDGTDRVKEQSGVGITHAIGSQSAGKGRTTRTLYATPSEDELVRIFGDEAPDAHSVIKTITIDPNNTTSVSYTSKEGKVIATCLTTNSLTSNLGSTVAKADTFLVNNHINENVAVNGGFVSTKRIAFSAPTVVSFGYKIECKTLELACQSISGACNYKAKIFIHDLTRQTVYESDELDLGQGGCVNGFIVVPPLQATQWTPQLTGSILQPGNYLVEKRVYSAGGEEQMITNAVSTAQNSIQPIIDLLTSWLDNVKTEEALLSFYDKVNVLNTDINNAYVSTPGLYGAPLTTTYPIFLDSLRRDPAHEVGLEPAYPNTQGKKPKFLLITSTCCNTLRIPINFEPVFECFTDSAFRANYAAHSTETPDKKDRFLADFEGYADSVFMNLDDTINGYIEDGGLQALLPGYDLSKHEFNEMIYHMLTDEYYVGPRVDNNGSKIVPPDSTNAVRVQYTCPQLWKCWINVVNQYKNIKDVPGVNGNHNVMQGADDAFSEDAGEGKQDTDDKGDDEGQKMNWFVKWMAGRKLSKALEDENNEKGKPYIVNLADLFLNCAGRKFAEILPTVTAEPALYPTDAVVYDNTKTTVLMYHDVATNRDNPYYPYITNPIFAFKYFVYDVNKSWNDTQLPAFVNIEVENCYNSTWEHLYTDLCEPVQCIEKNRFHDSWSSDERLQFYNQVKSYLPPTTAIDFTTPPPCPSIADLTKQIDSLVSGCQEACAKRQGEIRAMVVQLFLENCYAIGGCVNDPLVISESDIDKIVAGIIGNCSSQCDSVKIRALKTDGSNNYDAAVVNYNDPGSPNTAYPKCYIATCYAFDGHDYVSVTNFQTAFILPRCELLRLDQMKGWMFDAYLPDAHNNCATARTQPAWWNIASSETDCSKLNDNTAKYSEKHTVHITTP